MRISTPLMERLGIDAILRQQAKLSKTQLQISTGQRILTPSDDPSAAVRALDLKESLENYRQFQSNIQAVRSRLEFEDSVLAGADNVLQRARELTIQSLNDTLSPSDRRAIGQEMQQLLDEMLGLANTRDANGEYIFAGFRSDTVPFVFDSNRTPPIYIYQGDKNQRLLQIAPQRPMADGDSGFAVFEDIPSDSGANAIAAFGGRQSILNTLLSLTKALNGQFSASHGTIVGTKDLSAGIDYSSVPPKSFDLTVDGTLATIVIPAANYASADELVVAVNNAIDGTALEGTVVAQHRSGFIEFVSKTSGATSSVMISDDADGVLTDLGFTDSQIGTGADVTFHDAANAALKDIDAALQNILDTRASVGARLNALDQQEDVHDKFILDTQANLSELQDLDYAEAISRFNIQLVALQAAQQAYVKVQGLSLFNYL
ncbi:flagellar hook-associated protein FlgL [Methylocaldum szegediense]|uniref:Flagellar hook-associated protein 3 FlgL n=1 Tax=Methylocaldum szegediense TaxID=73780 RepID=A0ABM9I085_9GAMM|nr:flagellar hook-associated protein FlgL [Methylocaldum szegediense]CAI8805255.1 flagellar hook-associated protein 3 FlgL [Methylocaldum szegediense]